MIGNNRSINKQQQQQQHHHHNQEQQQQQQKQQQQQQQQQTQHRSPLAKPSSNRSSSRGNNNNKSHDDGDAKLHPARKAAELKTESLRASAAMAQDRTLALYLQQAHEILPGFLYLSSHRAARDVSLLTGLRITHVLNVAQDVPTPSDLPRKAGFELLFIPLYDSPTQQLPLRQTFAFMSKADTMRQNGKHARVLVHCSAGISRSAAVVIHYVMITRKCTLREAYTYTKQRKPNISPNDGFMSQLLEIEQNTHGKASMSIEDYRVDMLAEMTGQAKTTCVALLRKHNGDPYLALSELIT